MNSKQDSQNKPERTGEEQALRRAKQQARETAARTGTPLVIYQDGKIKKRIVNGDTMSANEPPSPSASPE